jgi:plastocyanin
MPRRTRTPLVLALAAVAAIAGCGDAGPTVRVEGTTFTVVLDDYLMRPQNIRVPSGRRLTVTVVNRGRIGHTFRIRSPNQNVLVVPTLPPGESASRRFRLAPGGYELYCALANHEELGMHGTLTVG